MLQTRRQELKNRQNVFIGGFQRFSLIDYPGEISATIFTSGCNFMCPYCHNPELVNMSLPALSEEKILNFLEKRKGRLTAVTITGGEPTLQGDLLEFIKKIKKMYFLVKLDTNGSNPDMLEKLIKNGLIDYAAMDVKAPLSRYNELAFSDYSEQIKKSIKIITSSTMNYEFRTTIAKSLLSREDIMEIGKMISGATNYYLQKFVPSKTLNPLFINENTYQEFELRKLVLKLEEYYVHRCVIR